MLAAKWRKELLVSHDMPEAGSWLGCRTRDRQWVACCLVCPAGKRDWSTPSSFQRCNLLMHASAAKHRKAVAAMLGVKDEVPTGAPPQLVTSKRCSSTGGTTARSCLGSIRLAPRRRSPECSTAWEKAFVTVNAPSCAGPGASRRIQTLAASAIACASQHAAHIWKYAVVFWAR